MAENNSAAVESEKRTITLAECQQHTTDKSCWLIIQGKVYDVTDFLEEHPGGFDIIVQSTGRDATQDFDEIGHSKKARELLEEYLIGTLEGGLPAAPITPASGPTSSAATATSMNGFTRLFLALLPVLLVAVAVALGVVGNSR